MSQEAKQCRSNLCVGKPLSNLFKAASPKQVHDTWVCGSSQQSLSLISVRSTADSVVAGLGVDSSPVLGGVDVARKWHNIKNKKQICLCPSRLPGIKRLSFQRSASRGLTQWPSDCSHFSMPRLLGRVYTTPAFWPGIPWINEFPPECTTMVGEARARACACCDVNLMTSRCSDGRFKQLNKGFVVFVLLFVGKGPPRLSYCSLLGTKQWSLCESIEVAV